MGAAFLFVLARRLKTFGSKSIIKYMKVIFLGTGEAFDENNPNNSSLVLSKKTKLLLDCGSTTPYELWKYNNDQNLLDAIYISHLHGDHCFGLPALVMRMWEEGREKPITIISEEDIFERFLEFGYKGFLRKFKFKVNYKKAEPGKIIKFKELELSFAETKHSRKNLAIKVSDGEKTICYSGDGTFTKETEKLYKDSDLVIHEAYLYNKKIIGHACITDLIKMAERNNIKCLALTHIHRDLRKELNKKKISSKKVKVIIPKPFDKLRI